MRQRPSTVALFVVCIILGHPATALVSGSYSTSTTRLPTSALSATGGDWTEVSRNATRVEKKSFFLHSWFSPIIARQRSRLSLSTTTANLVELAESTVGESSSAGAPQQPADNTQINHETSNATSTTTVKVHSYKDPRSGDVYQGLNTAKNKFTAFLQQAGVELVWPPLVTTEYVSVHHEGRRHEWRSLWKARRLVTDRTELLAVYPSDHVQTAGRRRRRRGGFMDLLHLYTERLVAILEDEEQEQLVDWLQEHYADTWRLREDQLAVVGEPEQLARLQHFLEWFRGYFPYYYDRCGHCGASLKEDLAKQKDEDKDETLLCVDDDEEVSDDSDDDDEDGSEYQTFIGYIYPNDGELVGKASRTELYQCHACRKFTRFPRFNSAQHVIEHRRGRCGEYSMLLFKFLRALGHEARWVVDWADHVWAEVSLGEGAERRWVHLDPCEAAVDDNLLYQGWGKKQTYILAFYAPARRVASGGVAWIEDVTQAYTSDSLDAIGQRRDESNDTVKASIDKAIIELQNKLTERQEHR